MLEGVALNSRWLLTAVERFTRGRLDPIRFIGGSRSELWCQILADVPSRTIDQHADPVSANARGATYDDPFGEFTGFYRRNRKAYARLDRDQAHG